MAILRITHSPTGTVLAEGPRGWGITPFEGNYYVRKQHLKTDGFRANYIPGLCFYKGLYVWLDLHLPGGKKVGGLGWRYWLPNPLFPFVAFRVGIPGYHPEVAIEELGAPTAGRSSPGSPA